MSKAYVLNYLIIFNYEFHSYPEKLFFGTFHFCYFELDYFPLMIIIYSIFIYLNNQ